jgi:rhodanese-related sulfurtransferase
MALFIDFLVEQWFYVLPLVVCLTLLMQHESRKGGPTLTTQQLINKVNQEQGVVVDIRGNDEFSEGHIVDALNIPQAKVVDRMAELEPYRDRPIILVCKMGQNTGAIGKQLRAKGFENVYRLSGGMTEWTSSQLPLVTK